MIELARHSPTVVQQVPRLPPLVLETALIEITIDRLQDRYGTSSLVNRKPLRRRELERLRQLGHDLGRPRLDQAWRVDTVLDRVQVARLRGDKAFWVAAIVHLHTQYRIGRAKA